MLIIAKSRKKGGTKGQVPRERKQLAMGGQKSKGVKAEKDMVPSCGTVDKKNHQGMRKDEMEGTKRNPCGRGLPHRGRVSKPE